MFSSKRVSLGWPLTLFVAGWLIVGCDNKVPYDVKEPPAQGKVQIPAGNSAKASSNSNGFIYCVAYTTEPSLDASPVSSSAFSAEQTVVARLSGLTHGKTYVAKWQRFDAAGKIVGEMGSYSFVADGPEYALFRTTSDTLAPDYRDHKPGRWRWKLEVPDHGTFTTEIEVRPRTEEESGNLARYEEAREQVIAAFSFYWLGTKDGTFHTIVSFRQKETPEIAALKKQLAEALAKETESSNVLAALNAKPEAKQARMFFGSGLLAQLRKAELQLKADTQQREGLEEQLSQKITGPRPGDFLGYLHVAGINNVNQGFSTDGLSDADRLNGITYRGSAQFHFDTFRYLKDGGWTEWQDCNQAPARYLQMFGELARSTPVMFRKRLNLEFKFLERDGNWIVTTSTGDQLINGRLTKAEGDWINERPTEEYAKSMQEGPRNFTRDSLRTMGQAARNNPTVYEESRKRTMEMLRGRTVKN